MVVRLYERGQGLELGAAMSVSQCLVFPRGGGLDNSIGSTWYIGLNFDMRRWWEVRRIDLDGCHCDGMRWCGFRDVDLDGRC